MSEYWVSRKKYFCRYCEIYIADDVPSRQQHENGLRHKGNTERFIRGLYKTSEKRKKEQEDEKREMVRVERAAQAAFAQDVGAGLVPSSSAPVSSSSTTVAPRKSSAKPANPYANYTTAASLGIKDPDVEKLAAEAERRRTQGVAGEWQVVTPVSPPVAEGSEATSSGSSAMDTSTNLKREADGGADEDDGRRFKLRKKTVGGGLGEIYDPGIIQVKSKKKEEPIESIATTLQAEQSKPAGASKWTKIQWIATVDAEPGASDSIASSANELSIDTQPLVEPPIKTELEGSPSDRDAKDGIIPKPEVSPSTPPIPESGGNLFRKRKVPTGATRGKRQM